jgi:hypothetical protein
MAGNGAEKGEGNGEEGHSMARGRRTLSHLHQRIAGPFAATRENRQRGKAKGYPPRFWSLSGIPYLEAASSRTDTEAPRRTSKGEAMAESGAGGGGIAELRVAEH